MMRCKLYAILLPAYTILGMEEEAAKLVGVMQTMLPLVKAEQSRVLALVHFMVVRIAVSIIIWR